MTEPPGPIRPKDPTRLRDSLSEWVAALEPDSRQKLTEAIRAARSARSQP